MSTPRLRLARLLAAQEARLTAGMVDATPPHWSGTLVPEFQLTAVRPFGMRTHWIAGPDSRRIAAHLLSLTDQLAAAQRDGIAADRAAAEIRRKLQRKLRRAQRAGLLPAPTVQAGTP